MIIFLQNSLNLFINQFQYNLRKKKIVCYLLNIYNTLYITFIIMFSLLIFIYIFYFSYIHLHTSLTMTYNYIIFIASNFIFLVSKYGALILIFIYVLNIKNMSRASRYNKNIKFVPNKQKKRRDFFVSILKSAKLYILKFDIAV